MGAGNQSIYQVSSSERDTDRDHFIDDQGGTSDITGSDRGRQGKFTTLHTYRYQFSRVGNIKLKWHLCGRSLNLIPVTSIALGRKCNAREPLRVILLYCTSPKLQCHCLQFARSATIHDAFWLQVQCSTIDNHCVQVSVEVQWYRLHFPKSAKVLVGWTFRKCNTMHEPRR